MKRLLSLKQRIEILKKIFDTYEIETDEHGARYTEVPLDDLIGFGLPNSCLNPAYWSGTSPGIRAAVALGKTVYFSKKHEIIRFLDLTPEDKAIWQERVQIARHKALLAQVDDSLIVDGDE